MSEQTHKSPKLHPHSKSENLEKHIESQKQFKDALSEQAWHKVTEKSMEPKVYREGMSVEEGLIVEEHDFKRKSPPETGCGIGCTGGCKGWF